MWNLFIAELNEFLSIESAYLSSRYLLEKKLLLHEQFTPWQFQINEIPLLLFYFISLGFHS